MRAINIPPPPIAPQSPEGRVDSEPASRLPRHPVRPLLDIEADAIRLREQLREWAPANPMRRPSGDLDVPRALRLRAFGLQRRAAA